MFIDIHSKQFKMFLLVLGAVVVVVVGIYAFLMRRDSVGSLPGGNRQDNEKAQTLTQEQIEAALGRKADNPSDAKTLTQEEIQSALNAKAK